MQLTRFDRWLREKFAYETHIRTLRLPDRIPPGIRVVDLPESAGSRYKHVLIARRSNDAEAVIEILRENSQMYATEIIDRNAWYLRYIAPEDKSISWWIISTTIIGISVFFALMYVKSLAEDPEFRQNFLEAIEILKG